MKIRCHTNLDIHWNERWPEELPCRPMVGDILTSNTGLELQVVRITFKEETVCHLELHLVPSRFENISQFEEWYNKR